MRLWQRTDPEHGATGCGRLELVGAGIGRKAEQAGDE
jgi:hypothetical protein